MKIKTNEQKLFDIASQQCGYFTSFQAERVGFTNSNQVYHVKVGNWLREWRGVFRLARYPIQDDSQYALWGIWSMNRKESIQGIYTHETALSLFELSDLQTPKLHMTFPRGHRHHGTIPTTLEVHHADIEDSEYEERNGYKVAKPYRTIIDIVRVGETSPEFVKQAVDQALGKGYLTQANYKSLLNLPRIGTALQRIMDGE